MTLIHHFRTLVAAAFLLATGYANAQATQDFSFVDDNVSVSRINGVEGCHNNVEITVTTTDNLTTGPVVHGQNGTSMQVPFDYNSNLVTDVLVRIDFSTPVNNPRLALRDLDYRATGVGWSVPHEWLTSLTPGFTISPYSPWPTPLEIPAGTVMPQDYPYPNDRDAGCWLSWNGCHSTISFVYNRRQYLSLFLDQLQFECECPTCEGCHCETQVELTQGETNPNEDGQLSAHLEINSNGAPIRQVNISLPWYDMVSSEECIDCGAHDATEDGHIYTATPISGISATFVGPPGILHSGEVTYCFPNAMEINEPVDLKLRFPEVLDLSCCKPDVDYCIKVEVIDKDCEYCEFLFCIPRLEGQGGGHKASPAPPTSEPAQPQRGELRVYPNPTNGVLNVAVPAAFAKAPYVVHDMAGKEMLSGKVTSTNMELNMSALPAGIYSLSVGDGTSKLESTFSVHQ